MNRFSEKQTDLLLAFFAFFVAFALWQIAFLAPLVYPLRLFVTMVHELGHGVAILFTGGDFVNYQVMSNGAGVAYSRGGVRPIIVSAGYVGTAIFGAALLYAADSGHSVNRPKWVAIALGIGFALLTLIYSGFGLRNIQTGEALIIAGSYSLTGYFVVARDLEVSRNRTWAFLSGGLSLMVSLFFASGNNGNARLTFFIGMLSAIALLALGIYARRNTVLFVLNFLAFAVGFNAITDAWVLFRIVRSDMVPQNDAASMEAVTSFPAEFWALVWIFLAILLLGGAIWLTFVRPIRQGKILLYEPERRKAA